MQAEVTISLKDGVLDPQAKAIHHAIDGSKDHHDDGRQSKFQYFPECKMVG